MKHIHRPFISLEIIFHIAYFPLLPSIALSSFCLFPDNGSHRTKAAAAARRDATVFANNLYKICLFFHTHSFAGRGVELTGMGGALVGRPQAHTLRHMSTQ